ncbi:pyruvate formate-lyase-activating protein [uncultured Fusobacterium sp.]|uniref:pyruvate formate-lyase-activating protein n=1 Tax=uncultured Fusobacterium sp. TaxID=159267 RepID=UPI0025F94560|nr:pyruvate formate-lyase-activating protein [uncultured Fusobacterium sp.]
MVLGNIHSYESMGTVDGPGIRFVVFLQGCPLRCKYCHNPDTWNIGEKKIQESAEDTLKKIKRYKNYFGKKGGVTVTGGEPLVQSDYILELFKLCKQEGIHTALDTSGYIFNEKVKEILEYTDLVLLDIKALDKEIYKDLTRVELDNTLKFLNYLQEIKKVVWIRHVVVPNITDDNKLLEETAKFLSKFDNIELVEILPYHTLGVFKYKELGIEYPLEGVEDLSYERKLEVMEIFKKYNLSVH